MRGLVVPEAVRTFLAQARWAEAARVALEPELRLLRGRAFARYGREAEAAEDFSSLGAGTGDLEAASRVELGLLGLRRTEPPEEARVVAENVLADSSPSPLTRARALMLRGIAEHRLDRWQRALRDLLEALALADREGDVATRVDVLRAMGVVHAWRGRHSQALLQLTLALADCALLDDKILLGELLGELARVNLEMKRHAPALELLRRQEELTDERMDQRSRIRLRLAKAQALIGMGSYEGAALEAQAALEECEAEGFGYLAFVASRDLALAYVRGARLDAAAFAIERARLHAGDDPRSYESIALKAVEAELAAAIDEPEAETLVREVVRAWSERDLVPLEVEGRLLEADLLLRLGQASKAERTLRIALGRARSKGLSRLEEQVRETMTRLDTGEGLVRESNRPVSNTFSQADEGYVLLEKLGSGAFGSVFRAFDLERGREVALKRMTGFDRYDTDRRRALLESARTELEAAARVSHPGVARVIAIGETSEGGIYVVQDFVTGPSLAKVMEDRATTSPGRVAATLRRLALALGALHAGGVVHRDVKPENVLCPSPDQPVLVDLGIATTAAERGDTVASRGTEAYAAPEQWRLEGADARSDLYSMGVIGFEWLTGRIPEVPSVPRRFRPWRRRSLSDGDWSELEKTAGARPLAECIAALLDADPDHRPQDGAEAANTLGEVLAAL